MADGRHANPDRRELQRSRLASDTAALMTAKRNLLTCRFPCGRPGRFRTVRDPRTTRCRLFVQVRRIARSFIGMAPSGAPTGLVNIRPSSLSLAICLVVEVAVCVTYSVRVQRKRDPEGRALTRGGMH